MKIQRKVLAAVALLAVLVASSVIVHFHRRLRKDIGFLIAKVDDSTYKRRRALFPSAVADEFDKFQPYRRGNAFADAPLRQLNELWTLDKHRSIPVNSNSIDLSFPMRGWERIGQITHFDTGLKNGIEVQFPQVVWVIGCIVVVWNETPYVSLTYETPGPSAPFVKAQECATADAREYRSHYKLEDGKDVTVPHVPAALN